MSRNPGIGSAWFEKYKDDIYPKDFITVRGHKCKPPKYYDLKMELTNQKFMIGLKHNRVKRAKASPDNTIDRLRVRQFVKKKEAKERIRKYETSRL